MTIIDDLKADYIRRAAAVPSGASRPDDPEVFVSGECTWALGTTLVSRSLSLPHAATLASSMA